MAVKIKSFDRPHAVPMMEVVSVIKTQYPAIVPVENRVIDVSQVVSCDHCLT